MRVKEIRKEAEGSPFSRVKKGIKVKVLNPEIQQPISVLAEPEPVDKDYRLGWEKNWQEHANSINSTFTAQSGIMKGLRPRGAPVVLSHEGAKSTFEMMPFMKYTIPENAMEWDDMTPDEKAVAFGWEALGLGLMTGTPFIAKYAGKGISKFANYVKNRGNLKFVPIEDAIETVGKNGVWKPFNLVEEATSTLKGPKGLGFAKDEAQVLARVSAGEAGENSLRALAWEKGDKLSAAWKKRVGQIGEKVGKEGILRKSLSLDKNLQETLNVTNMRAKWAKNLYTENLKAMGPGANLHYPEQMLKRQVEKIYGAEAAKDFHLGKLSDKAFSNYLANMFSTRGSKFIEKLHHIDLDESWIHYMSGQPDVFGSGEVVFGTKTAFDKLVGSMKASRQYSADKMNTLMNMLSEKGFGKVVMKQGSPVFKANKAMWNPKILTETRDLLATIDNLAQSGRMGKLGGKGATPAESRATARKAIEKLMEKSKADTPIVHALADTARVYSDILYKDTLQIWVPKAYDKVALSAQGEAKLSQLNQLWYNRADGAFKSTSTMTAPEKIALTKNLLKDYRALLKDANNFNEPLTKEAIQAVKERLAYGSRLPTGMHAYLEGYLPRVHMRGTSFAGYSKRALVGKSPHTYGRTSELSSDLESFQAIFQARTASQGKQLFFYDEAADIIDYAKTLPEAWRGQFDFTISKMLSQPSNWDHKLADVLRKVPFMGPMDANRAMRAARAITGIQYSGLLGMRPFAIYRNLHQTILMAPAELGGGIRDSYSIIRGLARAASPKHRKYMREIGAITDFMPDQQMRPALREFGMLEKYNTLKDTTLFFYRMSDRANRYWTGGAAVEKWNWAVKSTTGGLNNLNTFSRKVGLRHRPEWARIEIENLLKLGRHDEAKKLFVNDVVAKSQFLYTSEGAPRAMGSGGTQRIFTTFQSWWMNYGSAVSRWMTTGTGTDRIKRMGTAMIAATAVEQSLEWWAGRKTAIRAVGFGPFPIDSLGLPPAIKPMRDIVNAAIKTAEGYHWADQDSRQKGEKAFNDTLKGVGKLLPGGLAAQQGYEGFKEGGWPGAALGIMQKSPERFEPFFGRLK